MRLLVDLAGESGVPERRDAMFRGEHINVSEDRAVLHVALRMPSTATLVVDGQDVIADVHAVLGRMKEFAARVRSGSSRASPASPSGTSINVGIGGSDLGPVMAYEALRYYSARTSPSSSCPTSTPPIFAEAVHGLAAEETLFIISSKTFGTLETLANANSAA